MSELGQVRVDQLIGVRVDHDLSTVGIDQVKTLVKASFSSREW
jgi:hypothetical protein